ncbi:MAG: extracellular solute-binding protein [Sphaerochaetaceae bacterium]|jgi:ABC-type glycerol-3-phosphate transport system substrate-binding protein|nr:extracellular solute-binding protein [Spirochaetaceae bacterium]MDY6342806.1 extracellular solute-binding protein [Sphaerochaetaceae bacterium]
MKKLAVALASAMMLMPSLAFANGSSEKTPPQSGPVQLTLWHRWSGANADYLKQVVDAFEAKHPDIEITVVAKPGEYIQLLQAMVADLAAGNNPPDMFVGGYNMLNYVANELEPTQLKDLAPSPEALNELKSRFDESVYNITNIDGRQIGLPFALSNMINYVNMDIFRAAGLTEADIPQTWDDVFRVGKIIKEKTGKYGIAIQLPDTWADCSLIYSAGGTIKTADGKKVDLTNQGAIDALTMWQNLVKEGIAPIETDAESESNFAAGNLAMRPTTIMKINGYKSQATFDLKTAKLPSFAGRTNKLAAGGSAIISFSKDKAKKDAVWKFMDFIASKEGMTIFTKTGYLCVTKDDVPKSEYQLPAYEQEPLAIMWPNWPGGSESMEIERLYLDARGRIVLQGAPVRETLQKLEADCNKLL